MAKNNKFPDQIIVEKPATRDKDVEAVAAHVRAMLMRLIAKNARRASGRSIEAQVERRH